MDERFSLGCFNFCAARPMAKLIADMVTLTADEAVCFPLLSLLGFTLYFAFGARDAPVAVAGQRILRMYGDCGAVCLLEQFIKAVFRRPRPLWLKKKAFYCMPAEWYSFASGHAMRAAYCSVILIRPDYSPLPFLGVPHHSQLLLSFLIVWMGAVAISRICLAKHFATDVIAGVVIGIAVAASPSPTPQGLTRVVLACIFTFEVLVIAFSKRFRALIPGWPALAAIVIVFWLTFPCAA